MAAPRKPDDELTKQARDSRVRRAAKKHGLRAMRSRWQAGTPENRGGWMIVDHRNKVVDGRFYSLTDQAVLERFS
jgi:hypothetical protein